MKPDLPNMWVNVAKWDRPLEDKVRFRPVDEYKTLYVPAARIQNLIEQWQTFSDGTYSALERSGYEHCIKTLSLLIEEE